MAIKYEFKLSDEYYFEYSDFTMMHIGNYKKTIIDGKEQILKVPGAHFSSLDRAIRRIINMPSIQELQVEKIKILSDGIEKLEEKFGKIFDELEDGIIQALKDKIQDLEEKIKTLESGNINEIQRKIEKIEQKQTEDNKNDAKNQIDESEDKEGLKEKIKQEFDNIEEVKEKKKFKLKRKISI